MFQKTYLVPPLEADSDGLLQCTGNADGLLLFLKIYHLPLDMLSPKISLVFLDFHFFRLLSSLSMQNLLMFLHADNYGLLVWVRRA